MEVDAKHLIERWQRDLTQSLGRDQPDIVDDPVEREARRQVGKGRLGRLGIRKIDLAECAGEVRRDATRKTDDMIAGAHQAVGERQADALAGAGDEEGAGHGMLRREGPGAAAEDGGFPVRPRRHARAASPPAPIGQAATLAARRSAGSMSSGSGRRV